jgi:hypothetical protein
MSRDTNNGALQGPVARFAMPLWHLSICGAHGDEKPDALVLINLHMAVRLAALDEAFVERIEEASSPFWRAVHAAVEVLRSTNIEPTATEAAQERWRDCFRA